MREKGGDFQNHTVDANQHPHSVYISRVPMWKKPLCTYVEETILEANFATLEL
jgi:hypothetical protein